MANTPPLLSCGIKSAIVPPPRLKGHDPAHPDKNRNPISMLMFVETAQATVKMTKQMLEMLYTQRRP